MEYTPLEKDMNIISALDDEPNDVGGLSAAQLKAKFDEGGLAVKDYLNNTLLEELAQKDTDNEETYAKREELQGLVLGQIPDGTITEEKLDDTLKEEIDSAAKASDVFTKEETLSDETAAILGLPNTAVPDDAFQRIPGVGDVVPPQALRYADEFGVTLLPCDGQILPAEDYPLYAQVQGPLAGYEWEDFQSTGWPFRTSACICLQSGDVIFVAQVSSENTQPLQIFRSTDGGATFTSVFTTSDTYTKAALIQKESGKVLAICQDYVYSSTDNGVTWTATQKAGNECEYGVVEGASGRLFLAGGSVYCSDDDGVTWTESFSAPGSRSSAISKLDSGEIFWTFYTQNSSQYSSTVYATKDNGESWSRVFLTASSEDSGSAVLFYPVSTGSFLISGTTSGLFYIKETAAPLSLDGSLDFGTMNSNDNLRCAFIPPATVLKEGRSMFCLDGNWIKHNNKTGWNAASYLVLADGSVLMWYDGSNASYFWIMKSTPTTDTIVLPYKPGWFVRVA